ncbi:hypothetical protein [Streptomyces sp. NPDC048157]|uniref:deoxynucleotide monophosphate kinase family protein n=1 Tax=Streptomyces sp. NPDC048157 TaxID=3365503 RepID=UPI00371CB009
MHIGLMGYARSGKDTVGAYLTAKHGYRRVSFADPLKEAALKLDTWIDAGAVPTGPAMCRRLSELVAEWGWERSKDEYPEVRRFLQHLGQSIRDLDEGFWLRTALRKVDDAEEIGLPCVVTDVRYPNELAALRRRGFHLVFIDRPGVGPVNDHISEMAVAPADADEQLFNGGSLDVLTTRTEEVWERLVDNASRRHYARSFD